MQIKSNKANTLLLSVILLFSNSLYAATASSEDKSSTVSNTHCITSYQQQTVSKKLSHYLQPVEQEMKSKTGVYVLEQGIEAMLARAWLTDHAEQTIDVQYFIFSTDNVGLIAIDYLVRAADRGVKVRILVDDIMVEATGDELLTVAAHKNISIKIYNPIANVGKNIIDKAINLTTKFHQVNQRMHNKVFTVDGKVTITGGRNVADEYFGYDHHFNFRDRDVLLIGGITNTIQQSFTNFWQHPLSVSVENLLPAQEKNASLPDFSKLHQYACNTENFAPLVREKIHRIPEAIAQIQQNQQLHWLSNVEYISDKPGKNNHDKFLAGGGITTEKLLALIKSAKQSITIQTPYLITTDAVRSLLKSKIKQGVNIKILTNSLASNDNLEAFNGYQRDRLALLKTGVQLFEFKPDAKIRQKIMSEVMHKQLKQAPIFGLHAKTMVIDDKTTVIGTYNFDPRSANLNTENFVILSSKKIANSVKQGMLEEMAPENAWAISRQWNPDHQVDLVKQLKVKIRRLVPKSIL